MCRAREDIPTISFVGERERQNGLCGRGRVVGGEEERGSVMWRVESQEADMTVAVEIRFGLVGGGVKGRAYKLRGRRLLTLRRQNAGLVHLGVLIRDRSYEPTRHQSARHRPSGSL